MTMPVGMQKIRGESDGTRQNFAPLNEVNVLILRPGNKVAKDDVKSALPFPGLKLFRRAPKVISIGKV